MTTIFPADPCQQPIHISPPTAKTVREVGIESLLRDCLPYLLVAKDDGKTGSLIERVIMEVS